MSLHTSLSPMCGAALNDVTYYGGQRGTMHLLNLQLAQCHAQVKLVWHIEQVE
jgi:hypothetical protein